MIERLGPTAPFFKMQGSGNDFVVIDNRALSIAENVMADWARALCRRAFGVGADGLFFLENAPADREGADYVWHFFNADGSRAEMCGNGSRCAARLAYMIGLAPARHAIGTDAGIVRAEVLPEEGRVKVRLTTPRDQRLNQELEVAGRTLTVHFVNTGVPHAVVLTSDLPDADVAALGREIRFHPAFAPAGANVNFVQVKDESTLDLRTYERGVEAETFACGTGACASVVVTHALGLTGPRASLTTSGGEELAVSIENGDVFLTGGAEIVFQGQLNIGALGLSL